MPADPSPRWLRADLVGRRRILEDRLVRIEGERVAWVGSPADEPAGARRAERPEGLLASAYLDIHCHGGGGVDVHGAGVDALASGGEGVVADTADALRRFARFEAGRGIAGVLPTAVSIPLPALRTWLAAVGRARSAQRAARATGEALEEAEILGANLEGPALSLARKGAHDPTALVAPAALLAELEAEPSRWDDVRVVTVAPEGDGGLDLVRALETRGIVASIGHTAADTPTAVAAYQAGARSTTHLFNAMPPLLHRDPGVIGAVLASPTAHAEMIVDGVHVHPMLMAPLARALGDRLVYVSDGIAAAGVGDGELDLGSLHVTVRGAEARLADGTIAGSVTPLDTAVATAVASGVPIADAVAAASSTPARLIGARHRGAIRRGARADLVVLSPSGGRLRSILGGVSLREA